jgi:hypothetical protein
VCAPVARHACEQARDHQRTSKHSPFRLWVQSADSDERIAGLGPATPGRETPATTPERHDPRHPRCWGSCGTAARSGLARATAVFPRCVSVSHLCAVRSR